jgi:hypothetical protein
MTCGRLVSEIANGMRYAKRREVVPPVNAPDPSWKEVSTNKEWNQIGPHVLRSVSEPLS